MVLWVCALCCFLAGVGAWGGWFMWVRACVSVAGLGICVLARILEILVHGFCGLLWHRFLVGLGCGSVVVLGGFGVRCFPVVWGGLGIAVFAGFGFPWVWRFLVGLV